MNTTMINLGRLILLLSAMPMRGQRGAADGKMISNRRMQDEDKFIRVKRSHQCTPMNYERAKIIDGITKKTCKKRCRKRKKCEGFHFKNNKRQRCILLFYKPEAIKVVPRNKKIICGVVAARPSASPSTSPSGLTSSPSASMSTRIPSIPPSLKTPAPTSTWVTQGQYMAWGKVDFNPSDTTEFVLESETHSDLGVVITAHAFNSTDVDFMIDYEQDPFEENGYEAQPFIFFTEYGTYPESLTQINNNFGEFTDLLVGYTTSKIFTDPNNVNNNTWFSVKSASGQSHSPAINGRYTSLSLRIRRFNTELFGYYRLPGTDHWIQLGSGALAIPDSMKNVPLQFGVRVKKEYNERHKFTIRGQKLSGGPPIEIPTRAPTAAPTEKKTWINPGTEYKSPACESSFDRSIIGSVYETRGIGGGGAMSGLSISPWDSLWFVGTDMGTLFRSTNYGDLWYPVSHDEQTFTNLLITSGPVGFTTNPDVVVFASCRTLSSSKCIARRSIDRGATWSPVNVTGGTNVDNNGNPALDYIPKQWIGSLVQNSGLVFAIMHDGGGIYRSDDDGLDWNKLVMPFNDTNKAAGLFLDESTQPPYIYFASSHGVFMWKVGEENLAREIWTSNGRIHSFAGSRSSGRLTLVFVDDDTTACGSQSQTDCGYIHIFSEIVDPVTASTASFTFTKTQQKAFRVVSSPKDSTMFYATGARSWPEAKGTAVWVGSWSSVQNDFSYSLKFLQSDVDNGYSMWPAEKLDYSAVGLDVGYWDGGYYNFFVNPNNSSQAGGSGNFFLHTTRDGGSTWQSPFTEHADSCNTGGVRGKRQRWRSTGLEMTSVRWLKFNPFNTSYGFASVADVRMLRTDDSGGTWEISGGSGSGLISINTIYDYSFAGAHTVFAVGGNFHDWPHGWYKNLRRGAGGVFVSFDSGTSWRRLGKEASMNCDDNFFNVDCSLGDDMVRQLLSVVYDNVTSTLYIGSQASGVARLEGLEPIITNGTFEELDQLQWEWINSGLGDDVDRIIPELKLRNGKLYALLSGNAPHYTNDANVGIYEWDGTRWVLKRGTIVRPSEVSSSYDLWAYPTGFEVHSDGTMWLIDMETNGNYLASGVWRSSDDGLSWQRKQQFTFPYNVLLVGSRIYASGANAWGQGGMLHSDDGGDSWTKNTDIPLLSNGNSVVIDPLDQTKLFYTFFGGGMLHGPIPE